MKNTSDEKRKSTRLVELAPDEAVVAALDQGGQGLVNSPGPKKSAKKAATRIRK